MIAAAEAVRPPGVGAVLRRAARDFYEESWRLVLLNTALSAYVLVVLGAAAYVPAALVLLVGVGPLAAALVSAAVIVVDTGSLTIAETTGSVRRCWRRGLALGGLVAFVASGDRRRAAVLRLGVGARLAARDPDPLPHRPLRRLPAPALAAGAEGLERPLRALAADAGVALLRRPAGALGLAVALLLINTIGLAAAVLPFLTMTPAYSALAAARFSRGGMNQWPP